MTYSDTLKATELIPNEYGKDTLHVATAVCPNAELVCECCLDLIPAGVGHYDINGRQVACSYCHDSLIAGRPLISKAAVGCYYTYGPVV